MSRLVALGAVCLGLWIALPSRHGAGLPSRSADHPGMVLVPAGSFLMGSTPRQLAALHASYGGLRIYTSAELPQRRVETAAFYIDRVEVTNAMYAAFVADTGHRSPDESAVWAKPYRWPGRAPLPLLRDHPATLVSFDDAVAFCVWRGMRLPSEPEWEKAARGSDGRAYPWGDRYAPEYVAGADRRSPLPLSTIAAWTGWWRTTYRGRMRGAEVGTFPVGRFAAGASPYGALDMAGNVFEWVDARFDPYPGAGEGHPDFGRGYRVVRGGDWYLDRIYHRAAARLRAPADHRVPTIGFRCVCGVVSDRHPPLGRELAQP